MYIWRDHIIYTPMFCHKVFWVGEFLHFSWNRRRERQRHRCPKNTADGSSCTFLRCERHRYRCSMCTADRSACTAAIELGVAEPSLSHLSNYIYNISTHTHTGTFKKNMRKNEHKRRQGSVGPLLNLFIETPSLQRLAFSRLS